MKQKKSEVKKHFVNALISLIYLAVIVIGVSAYLITDDILIGPAFLLIGTLNFSIIKLRKIKMKYILSDLTFGLVDNSIMVFGAIIGAQFGGIVGAIIGGAAGNTITDGIGGLFEGYVAEKQENSGEEDLKRRMWTGVMGKMTGCLFGAGLSLSIVGLIKFLSSGI